MAISAGLEPNINSRKLSAPAEQVLRAADVHHRQRTTARVDAARHRHRVQLQTILQLQAIAGKHRARCRIEKYRAWCKQCHPVGVFGWHRHQAGCHRRNSQCIDADDPQQLALVPGGIFIQRISRYFQDRAGHGDLGASGNTLVHRFVKTTLHRPKFQVRLTIDRPYRLRKLGQGGVVD